MKVFFVSLCMGIIYSTLGNQSLCETYWESSSANDSCYGETITWNSLQYKCDVGATCDYGTRQSRWSSGLWKMTEVGNLNNCNGHLTTNSC